MKLTIQQVKEKQKELKANIEVLLNKYYEETGVKAVGEIKHGNNNNLRRDDTTVHWCNMEYKNPFA